jgi:aldehyde dehydrogenase (NAD+)
LAAGNTVVLKPAESTSLTALKLAEIIEASGLPAGVVNIVTGHGDTGAAIVNHPDIDKIAFTGSTAVGKLIQRAVAGTSKKVSLELGGKSANIVLEDAPLDQAVEGIVNGIFFNQGHVCCAGSRLYVQESIADELVRKLKQRMKSLYLGNPLDKNTDIGAINSKEQLETIEKYLEIGIREGADMFQVECDLPSKGFYCRPTIFTNVAQSSVIAQEEIFGPVLTVQTFRTIDEVIQKANNSPYGLAAGVWTDKGSRIFNLTSKLRAGVVWANTYNKFDPASPFGGYKESGFGREGGLHCLEAYLK